MTTSSPDDVTIAPFRLDRIGGISVTAVNLSTGTRQVLDQLAIASAAVEQAARPLVDAIFELVPKVSAADRRSLLAAKRRIHRGERMTPDEGAALVMSGVPDLEVKTWMSAVDDRESTRTRLAADVAGAQERTSNHLRNCVRHESLARTLPLIAPEFLERLEQSDLRPGTRAARTALLYLIRSALKPSPLRHLTAVALYPNGSNHRTDVTVSIGLVHQIFMALAATPRFTDAFDYTVAYRVPTDPRLRLVVQNANADHGSLWSQERIIDASEYTAEIEHAAKPPERIARLVRMGVIVPIVPWTAGARDALPELASLMDRSTAVDASDIAAQLRDLDRAVADIGRADGAARQRIMPALTAAVTALTERAGVPGWEDTIVHEDVAVRDAVGDLGGAVAADLAALAADIRPFLFRSHGYDLVVNAFRSAFGAGGRCADAAGFFLTLQTDPGFVRLARRAKAQDLTLDVISSDRAHLPVGQTSAPPAAALMYQIASTSLAAVQARDYLMVVNQIGSALGGLLTRFGRVFESDAVTTTLQPWLSRLFPHCDVRSLTLSAQVNNLQHTGAGYLPAIHWPVERQRRAPGASGLDQIGLRHDLVADTLEFTDADGAAVAPVYTGIVPAGLCGGGVQFALTVMDPWVDGSPLTRSNHPVLRARAIQGGVDRITASERLVKGRVVLRRAQWLVPADQFPMTDAAHDNAGYLSRLDSWRRGIGLPAEVYFVALSADPFDANRRKPMWLDFASPHSVRTALPLIAGSTAVRFEESLPSRADAWVPGSDGPRMTEHLSFLAWDRPERGAR